MNQEQGGEDEEEQKEARCPEAKKARKVGGFGQGWEHLNEGRSPDPGGKDPQGCRKLDIKPKTFSDIELSLKHKKQRDIRTMFDKVETGDNKASEVRASTPVRTKVQRYEARTKQKREEIGNTLRKVKKARDKPGAGEGAKCSIKKYFQRLETLNSEDTKVTKGPNGPLTHGATVRSGSARTSRLTSESPVREGGKKAGGRIRDRTRSGGTLGRWLLLGKMSRPSALLDTGREGEKEGSLESRGGSHEEE